MESRCGCEPIVVASENGAGGAAVAMDLLRSGAGAVEAAVAAASCVEQDLADHSVGIGGIPNILGQVELDASVMDGRTRRAGAVAALRGHADAARTALHVLENSPHVLVAGTGARRLAREIGFPSAALETEAAQRKWRDRFSQAGMSPPAQEEDQLLPAAVRMTTQLSLDTPPLAPPETGTVNFLVRDGQGHLASVVSTSGLGWKYPGRVGDSPIIGAGNYCDDRAGAAACTGKGELCMRVLTAYSVVSALGRGVALRAAATEALQDLASLERADGGFVGFIALTPDGRHLGCSEHSDRAYVYMTGDMAEPDSRPRLTLPELAEGRKDA